MIASREATCLDGLRSPRHTIMSSFRKPTDGLHFPPGPDELPRESESGAILRVLPVTSIRLIQATGVRDLSPARRTARHHQRGREPMSDQKPEYPNIEPGETLSTSDLLCVIETLTGQQLRPRARTTHDPRSSIANSVNRAASHRGQKRPDHLSSR